MSSVKHLVVIVGPTAIGKTSLSIELAQQFQTEIVSADSRQFFKEMAIGTAKPDQTEMAGIAHHFVDFLPVSEWYTAGKFETDALAVIERLHESHNTVILVGGSGLYVDAICKGIDEIPSDLTIREQLIVAYKTKGLEPLQLELKAKDPEHYNRMDLQNPQRLIRALEVCRATGLPYSRFRKTTPKKRPFQIHKIGLTAAREVIYKRINLRVDLMLEAGLLKEVESLLPYRNLNALNTVGYKEFFPYFDGDADLESCVDQLKQNTRRFAKRQLTWFRKDQNTVWFDVHEKAKILPYLTELGC